MLANIILGVKDAGDEIAGVFRYERTCKSALKLFFEDFFKPAPELTLIKKLKLKEIKMKSANSKEFQKLLVSLNVDLVIIGTWQEKISKKTFDIPAIATVNVHPSLLPKYRGPNPYLQTILHGEEFSGVTIHLLNENYDAGAILKQEKVRIFDTDTSKELRERTVAAARGLVCGFMSDIKQKILTPVSQAEKYATYFPNITGNERMLDFRVQTSDEISRTIRALHPFLPCYITHDDNFFIVDAYNFRILDATGGQAGEFIAKNPEQASVTIVCKDKKAIVFSNLKLYKSKNVKGYIKKHIK